MNKHTLNKITRLRKLGCTWEGVAKRTGLTSQTCRSNFYKVNPDQKRKYRFRKDKTVTVYEDKTNTPLPLLNTKYDDAMMFVNPILKSDISPFVKVKLVMLLSEEGVI
jgi:hypothetical protein